MVEGIPDVVDVLTLPVAEAGPTLAIEVPHGAIGDWEYHAVADRLRSPLPDDLIAFFHVNTDAGAAELGLAMARRLRREPGAVGFGRVVVVRSRIPRTFIDCNRVLGADAAAYRAGGVTPGVPPWVTHPDDHALLLERYDAYQRVARAVIDEACGAGGRALLLHTYAPRTVDVEVGPDIVPQLRAAYAEPERWPLRPEIDVIHRMADGTATHGPAGLRALADALDGHYGHAEGQTYPLHPVTTAYAHVARHPGRVVCVEVRRDLLTEAFTPFRQVQIDPARVDAVAAPLARWAAAAW